jgi:hypothetical protein
MLIVSARTLNILAALVWYAGGVALLLKGTSLLYEARLLRPDSAWPFFAGAAGVTFGVLKAKFLFSKACRKNLLRIASLSEPKPWQFYRLRFFAVLAFVVWGSARLSSLIHGDYLFLILMAALDLSISIALLGSSYVFWSSTKNPAG